MDNDDSGAAMYLRVSTPDQDVERQRSECRDYLESNGYSESIDEYADIVTGASEGRSREQYDTLWESIEAGEYTMVAVHEISRLSRLGRVEVVEFISHCMEHETGIKSVGGVGIEIKVDDPQLQKTVYRMLAGLMADLAQIEHEQMMQRIESGIKTAQNEGKWMGRPPTGFETDDNGFLRVKPEEFLQARRAVERVEHGESVSSVSSSSPVAYGTLQRLCKEHRDLYLAGESEDERIVSAIESQFVDVEDLRTDDEDAESSLRDIIREEIEAVGEGGEVDEG
jgi:DNA invertase Pin-like site-specific DNA recombinase